MRGNDAAARVQNPPCGNGGHALGVKVVEDNRLFGQAVQVRSLHPLAAIGRQIVSAKRIRDDQDHIEIVALLFSRTFPMRAAVFGCGGCGDGARSHKIGGACERRTGFQQIPSGGFVYSHSCAFLEALNLSILSTLLNFEPLVNLPRGTIAPNATSLAPVWKS